jgi:hypothetical protein
VLELEFLFFTRVSIYREWTDHTHLLLVAILARVVYLST